MADDRQPPTSQRLDRVGGPGRRRRPSDGKEALFSTAPTAPQPPQVEVRCRRCGSMSGVGLQALPGLLTPPSLWNPISGFLWGRCPSCRHRARLDVRTGQALRAVSDMVRTAVVRLRG
jgi:ribosomal protein S27E